MLQRQARARPHLGLIALGHGDLQAGGDQGALAGLQRHRGVLGHGGAQVHAGGAGAGVVGRFQACVVGQAQQG